MKTSTREQERKNRKIYINKVKRFARSKTGLRVMEQLAPEVAEIIREHPDWLDIAQYYNDPRVCGNYRVDFYDRMFYTGESGNALLRIAEHIYAYRTGDVFGQQYNAAIPAKFEVFAWRVTDKNMRELIEASVIEKHHPKLQWTDPEAPEYGIDKPIPDDGKTTRETLRPDICILRNMRADRFRDVQEAYNKEHLNLH